MACRNLRRQETVDLKYGCGHVVTTRLHGPANVRRKKGARKRRVFCPECYKRAAELYPGIRKELLLRGLV